MFTGLMATIVMRAMFAQALVMPQGPLHISWNHGPITTQAGSGSMGYAPEDDGNFNGVRYDIWNIAPTGGDWIVLQFSGQGPEIQLHGAGGVVITNTDSPGTLAFKLTGMTSSPLMLEFTCQSPRNCSQWRKVDAAGTEEPLVITISAP